jgi:Tol biopolymer transport system component
VSPGGGQVAYFGRQSSGSLYASLFVKDLNTGQIRTVSSQCPLQGFAMAPVDWIQQNLAWSPDGTLFFVEQGDAGSLIRRFDPREGVTTNVTGVLRTRLIDLYPSRDGHDLAYLLHHDGSFQIRRRSLATGHDRIVATIGGRSSDLSLKGWSSRDELVLTRRFTDVPEAEWPVMEVLLARDGDTAPVARLVRAFAFSARLSASGDALLYSGTEQHAHNIYALSLATGASRRLTANQLRSVTFSGIEPLADGSLIYAQDDRRQDIWLSRTAAIRSRQ